MHAHAVDFRNSPEYHSQASKQKSHRSREQQQREGKKKIICAFAVFVMFAKSTSFLSSGIVLRAQPKSTTAVRFDGDMQWE